MNISAPKFDVYSFTPKLESLLIQKSVQDEKTDTSELKNFQYAITQIQLLINSIVSSYHFDNVTKSKPTKPTVGIPYNTAINSLKMVSSSSNKDVLVDAFAENLCDEYEKLVNVVFVLVDLYGYGSMKIDSNDYKDFIKQKDNFQEKIKTLRDQG